MVEMVRLARFRPTMEGVAVVLVLPLAAQMVRQVVLVVPMAEVVAEPHLPLIQMETTANSLAVVEVEPGKITTIGMAVLAHKE